MRAMKHTNPFVVRGYRAPEFFCDRERETEKLLSAFANDRNVTLLAPRRYGKTGLIRNAFHRAPDDWTTVYADVYATSDLREFTQVLANAVAGSLDTVAEKAVSAAAKFFKSVRPTITPTESGGLSFSFSVEKRDAEATLDGIFDYIASKDRRVVVAIDEFQQILEYPEKGTEAMLRSRIQFLQNANFVFAGSRHHLLGEMFTSPRRPFYQSTDVLSLDVIPADRYEDFAGRFFRDARRPFSAGAFASLYRRFDGVTWYLQSVLNRVWGEGGGLASEADVDAAVRGLVEDRSLTFHDLLAAQSGVGRALLKAVAAERVVPEITASAFLRKHGLSAPSSVRTAVPALLKRDLLYRSDSGYLVYDYLFADYLRGI